MTTAQKIIEDAKAAAAKAPKGYTGYAYNRHGRLVECWVPDGDDN
jgi:hypothetical protein